MKKSTLITTIAMIVVVVVALSTATYAWFSSTSTAIANTSFTTEASGDWTIMKGTVANNALAFEGAAADTITLDATAISAGLWCPTATIAAAIADSDASTTLSDKAGFVQAQKNGNDYKITKLQTAAYDSTVPDTTNGLVAPFALRLVNVSGATKTLQLNITVNAGSQGTNNSMYAAAAVRFYVYEVKNTDNGTGTAYTSGYNITNTAGVDALTAIGSNITKGTAVEKSSNLKALTSYNDETPVYTNVTIANYNVGDISTQFNTAPNPAGADLQAIGIAAGDKYITYSFDLGVYNANDFSNIIIYTWIDGWVANASAARASFNVNYGFVSNQVYVAPTPVQP